MTSIMWEYGCCFFFPFFTSLFLFSLPFFSHLFASVPVVKLGTYMENVNNICSPDFFIFFFSPSFFFALPARAMMWLVAAGMSVTATCVAVNPAVSSELFGAS